MKKNSFKSGSGIYLESLRQLRTFGIVILCISLFVTLANGVSKLSFSLMSDNFGTLIDVNAACGAIYFVCYLAAPVMTFSIFGWMNSRKSSDFYHALPYKRESIFLNMVAAVFTWCAGLILINFAVGTCFYALFPNIFITDYHDAFSTLLAVMSIVLLVISSVSLAMSITGTRLTNIIVSLLIMFVPRGIISLMVDTVYSRSAAFVEYFIPFLLRGECNLLYSMSGFSLFNKFSMLSVLYTFLLALIYGAAALVLFKKRNSEMAHTSAPGRIVQAIYRIVFTYFLTLLLISESFTYGFDIIDFAIGLGFIVIAYFLFELITTKKWKNLLRAIPGLFIVAAMCVVSYFTIDITANRMMAFSPEASEIEYVKLISDRYNLYSSYILDDEIDFYDYAMSLSSGVEIRDDEVKRIASTGLKNTLDEKYYNGTSVIFKIKCGGKEYARRVYISENAYQNLYQALSDHEDYKKGFVTLPEMKGIYYSGEFGAKHKLPDKVYDELREDIASLGFENWIAYMNSGYSYFDEWVYILSDVDGRSIFISVPLSIRYTPRSMETYLECIDNDKRRDECLEYLEAIPESIEKAIEEEIEYMYCSVSAEAHLPDGQYAYSSWYFDKYDYDRADDEKLEFDDFSGEGYSDFLEILKSTKGKDVKPDGYIVVRCYGYFDEKKGYTDFTVYYPLTDENIDFFAWYTE